MDDSEHIYQGLTITWAGNTSAGANSHRTYGRDHDISGAGLPSIEGSADSVFRGDPRRWNPEQLLVVALTQCRMLRYLHLAAEAGIVVTAYEDKPIGIMVTNPAGDGQFKRITLQPRVRVAAGTDLETANRLHDEAAKVCFITRSVNFPVEHRPEILSA